MPNGWPRDAHRRRGLAHPGNSRRVHGVINCQASYRRASGRRTARRRSHADQQHRGGPYRCPVQPPLQAAARAQLPARPLFDGIMARESGKGWWDEFNDTIGPAARNLAELESRLTMLRTQRPRDPWDVADRGVRPGGAGRLRVSPSTRRPIHRVPPGPPAVLTGVEPVRYRAVIHESALHTRVGGPAVMRRQTVRLMEVSRLPHLTVQVYPFEVGVHSAHTRALVHFGGGAPNWTRSTWSIRRPRSSCVMESSSTSTPRCSSNSRSWRWRRSTRNRRRSRTSHATR